MVLNSTNLDNFTSIDDLVGSTSGRIISFASNDCVCVGTARDFIMEWVHTVFLKDKDTVSKEDKPSWWEDMIGEFSDKYWKESCK